jgi:hypothetical protein
LPPGDNKDIDGYPAEIKQFDKHLDAGRLAEQARVKALLGQATTG